MATYHFSHILARLVRIGVQLFAVMQVLGEPGLHRPQLEHFGFVAGFQHGDLLSRTECLEKVCTWFNLMTYLKKSLACLLSAELSCC
jgi:hypothetical protein